MPQTGVIQFQRSKYLTRNPISQRLIAGFRVALTSLIHTLDLQSQVHTLIEFGCGEGVSTSWIAQALPHASAAGFDIHRPSVSIAAALWPGTVYAVGDVTQAPFQSECVDLALILEVMEHVHDPLAALRQVKRVSRQWCILSVPREPLWRILNMARGAYHRSWGNTPGHVNHWSRRSFIHFLSQELEVVRVASPLPWTIAACRVR
ncbi:MAG: class I SAM-dependent methyltransferase [Chloroflexi bacterium]|nr:class I SAM-dependent methyltransferase [Chloroflexota bacterium]